MYCKNCGKAIADDSQFCPSCGTKVETIINTQPKKNAGRIGYSNRINEPIFSKYLKRSNRLAFIFSIILAVAAVAGFYFYGEVSSEMHNPEALLIGLGVGAMFLIIGVYTIIARKTSKTWDGVVVDKKTKEKTRSDDDSIEYYTEYTVVIRSETGKKYKIVRENDELFNYYQVGDKVRHHAGFDTYEKYDKSNDTIIFCVACGVKNKISDDKCRLCKCPLLK